MAETYTDPPATDMDWVRFLIDDTVATFEFTDEEITAVLSEETATGTALKYYAAAYMLDALATRWARKGKGLAEKQVSKLRLSYGLGPNVGSLLKERSKWLREEGARRMMPSDRSAYVRMGRRY